MRALAVLVACLCLGAAPVPPAPRVAADDLAGAWCYRWNGTPGVMFLHESGAYLACHASEVPNYAGLWWVDRGRVIVTEYPVCACGFQRGQPVRYEFAATRAEGGYRLTTGTGTTVTLTRGE